MADEKLAGTEAKLEPGLCCPRCQAPQVSALKPNGISPKPGYRCLACETRMRGSTGIYVVVVLVGLGLLSVAAGALAPFRNSLAVDNIQDLVRAPMGPGSMYIALPLYLFLVGYAVRELTRPRPRRI